MPISAPKCLGSAAISSILDASEGEALHGIDHRVQVPLREVSWCRGKRLRHPSLAFLSSRVFCGAACDYWALTTYTEANRGGTLAVRLGVAHAGDTRG
jgi:hypothetical protein